jgi:iron complex outermembrane recepter protein
MHGGLYMNRSGRVLFGFSLALGLGLSTDILAQQQAAATSDQLQEVIVTAQRRAENLQRTPISITAVTGQNIAERGVVDFDTLAQSLPGISEKSGGPGQTEFEMRGLSSQGGNSAVVGFYLDDVPLSAPGAQLNGRTVIDPDLYDLNRVEVLRGPQGTLYGSSSMGGTVKIITNPPDPKAFDVSEESIASDTSGGGFNYGENGMLNLPLGDTAAMRIVASYLHNSGWIDRIVIAAPDFGLPTNNFTTRFNVLGAPVGQDFKGVNDEDLTSARISVLWHPTEGLEITPMFLFQRITQGGLNQIDTVPGTNAHYQPFNYPESYDDRVDLASLNVKYQFDGFELSSTTAHYTREEFINEDPNEEIQWVLAAPPVNLPLPFYPSEGGLGSFQNPGPTETDTTSQTSEEVRVASTGDSPLQWVAGYFYSDYGSDTNLIDSQPGGAAIFGTANSLTQLQPMTILQNSVFGEASYKITPKLTATVGVRRYSFVSQLTNTQSGAFSVTGNDTTRTVHTEERDQGASPKVNFSYQATPDLLLYTTAAKGFRPGGGNIELPTVPGSAVNCESALMQAYNTNSYVPSPLTFNPDHLWSYELGEKSEWLEHRLSVNAATYFEQWDNVQQYLPLSCGFVVTANAGDAHIYGGELELNAVLTTGLVLSVNGSYIHGSFVSASFGPLSIASGNQLQNTPTWTSSESLSYRYPLTDDLTVLARVDNNYVGSHIDVTYGVNHIPSYDLTNVRIGVEATHWGAALFANNVANHRAVMEDVFQQYIQVPTFQRGLVSQPLTIGVDFTYHFR